MKFEQTFPANDTSPVITLSQSRTKSENPTKAFTNLTKMTSPKKAVAEAFDPAAG